MFGKVTILNAVFALFILVSSGFEAMASPAGGGGGGSRSPGISAGNLELGESGGFELGGLGESSGDLSAGVGSGVSERLGVALGAGSTGGIRGGSDDGLSGNLNKLLNGGK